MKAVDKVTPFLPFPLPFLPIMPYKVSFQNEIEQPIRRMQTDPTRLLSEYGRPKSTGPMELEGEKERRDASTSPGGSGVGTGQGRSTTPITSVSTQPILVKGMNANRSSYFSSASSYDRDHLNLPNYPSSSTAAGSPLPPPFTREGSLDAMPPDTPRMLSAAEVAAAAAAAASHIPTNSHTSQYSVGGLLPYARSFASRFLLSLEADDTPFRGDGGPGEVATGGGARQLEGVIDPDLEVWISDEERDEEDHEDADGDDMEGDEERGKTRKASYYLLEPGNSIKGVDDQMSEGKEREEGDLGRLIKKRVDEESDARKDPDGYRVKLGRSASTGHHRRRASTSVVGSREMMPSGNIGRLSPSNSPSSLSLLSHSESSGFGSNGPPNANEGR